MRRTLLSLLLAAVSAYPSCESLPTCGACMANMECGWCSSSSMCMPTATSATCVMFETYQCPGEPCSYHVTCTSCARNPFCMFNNANGLCEQLPAKGFKPAPQFTADGSACGQ